MISADTKPAARRRGLRWLVPAIVVIAGAGGAYWYFARGPETSHVAQARPKIPVSIATAGRHDLPIYLSGLGTVQASFTVSIHSQVDGKLIEVLFTEGQHVKKGDVLAKIDPRLYQAALDQAVAHKKQDQAALVAAQKDLDRFKELAVKSFETQQNVDQQQAKVDQTKAAIAADDAAIETAQTQLDYTSIKAPSDGRMGVRLVDPGNIVHASDQQALATLTLTRPSAVLFTLPARYLEDVRAAMAKGPVTVTAYDQDNVRALSTGKLLLIDNLIDQTTATIRLKAMFDNDDERLWPGEFVNARILIDTQQNVLAVPPDAVKRGPDGLYTWIITSDNTAEMRPIKVGATSNGLTIVTAGLTDGEKVVTDGQYKLQPNVPVSINAPGKAADASGAPSEPL